MVSGATPTPTATAGPDAFERSGRGVPLRITLPPPGTPEPYPLIVALHSLHYDGTDPKANWDLDGLAQAAGLAVVYPDGIGKAWNAGTCCDVASARNIDDVGYLRALIAHLSANYPIDRARVSLVGLSNGGMLAYRYACEHGDEIAGIAVVSASRQVARCQPAAPLTLVVVHGGADQHVPYQGTPWSPVLNTAITPVEQSMAPIRAQDGCPPPNAPGDTVLTDGYGVPLNGSQSAAVPDGLSVSVDATGHGGGIAGAAGTVTGPGSVPPSGSTGTGLTVIRREAACTTSARVVEYLIPTMGHGWPPRTGTGSFATAGVLWNLLAPARSARPGPRM
ncbi:PHB depolymerase family esterase [Frankia sp. R82]|uniref:alpha/beta hydrolase family esterase n=1 Tax=Frankia sp. R82 TaxID=2950553 RepID=UPI002044CA06|nr:PHB depolymerase family esterase [Frankia sp. R82]MCM3887366.1 plasmid partitioning protein [Frankia sp. R82]